MIELREILEKSLSDDSSLTITVNCNIPELTLRINDSRQMIYYGIGLDGRQGFTLSIDIDNESKKGTRLIEKLNETNFLNDFKPFESKKSTTFLKDFRKEIGLLEKSIQDLLDNFENHPSGQGHQLTVNRTDGKFRLE